MDSYLSFLQKLKKKNIFWDTYVTGLWKILIN